MGEAEKEKKRTTTDQVNIAKDKVYFSGLNGLRFIAATLVIVHHIEQNKNWRNLPNLWGKEGYIGNFIDALGHHAVSFFFVLSGFLISYLLLDEDRKYGKINVRNFYIRRLLRIWPLYYLLLVIAFFLLPKIIDYQYFPERIASEFDLMLFVLFFIMLPNVARLSSHTIMGLNQSWSIGVEEQFYLMWPVLVRKFKNNFLRFLLAFILIKMFIGLFFMVSNNLLEHQPVSHKLQLVIQFWDLLQIEQMAIGAIGAYFLFTQNGKFFKIIYNPILIFFSLGIWAVLIFFGSKFFGHTLVEGFVFIVIIMNVSVNKQFPIKFEGRWMNYMGNISYGIYMYHNFMIALVLNFLLNYFHGYSGTTYFNIALYFGAIISTWVIAALSYRFFEMPFLKLKKKFQLILSGN